MKYSESNRNQRRCFHNRLTRKLIAEKVNIPYEKVSSWIMDQKEAGKYAGLSNRAILKLL